MFIEEGKNGVEMHRQKVYQEAFSSQFFKIFSR